jgi:hypothetical protein
MKKILLFTLYGCILYGCGNGQKTTGPGKNIQVVEEKIPVKGPMIFSEGIPAYLATTVKYKRNNRNLLKIQFNDPAIVSVASKPEKWGFFQFPHIGKRLDGSIQVKWNLTMDAIQAYGTDNAGYANSTDGGKTWKVPEKHETVGGLLLPNGDRLDISTPKPIKVEELKLPKSVGTGTENYGRSTYTFYNLHDMPESRNGVFLKRLKKGETEWKEEQASLYDPNAARYSLSGLVPVVWWGDMHVAADGALICGIYPGFLIGENGLADPRSGVFFYRSTDEGHSWRIQGRILYKGDPVADPRQNERMGFTEPAFEILKDGTFLCVMRTTDGAGLGPMYASYSKDMGQTWTNPEAIASAGVLPQLLQLDNGIVVMASGRPGVQLRFSTGGKDKKWTDPFEMLPNPDSKKSADLSLSCGYTGLLATGSDRFLLVFSDFKYKTEDGNIRKAIKVQEVIVKSK